MGGAWSCVCVRLRRRLPLYLLAVRHSVVSLVQGQAGGEYAGQVLKSLGGEGDVQ